MIASPDGRCVLDEDTHSYTLDGFPIPGVSELIQGAGYAAPYSEAALPFIKHKGQIGKALHAASHFLEEGELDRSTVHAEVVPYLDVFEEFLEAEKPELIAVEQIVYHKELYYAGTLDRIYRMPRLGLISPDLKTSVRISPQNHIQSCLYSRAHEERTGEYAAPYILHLQPKSKKPTRYDLIRCTDYYIKKALSCADTYEWRATHRLIEGITRPVRQWERTAAR